MATNGTFRNWCKWRWSEWWDHDVEGVDKSTSDWFPYRMQSKKFRQLLFVDAVALLFGYTIVVLFHVHDSEVAVRALELVERVTIAYFGLNVIQKGVETWGQVKSQSNEGEL